MTVYVHCGWWDIVKGCVCVWLHRLCVRMYLWVCISLPLVFLTSKTVTSSEKSRIFSPVMLQNYITSLLEKEYSVLITAATGSNIITRVKISDAKTLRLLFSYSVYEIPLGLARCDIRISLVWFSYQGSSERARGEQHPKRAACSDPALTLESTQTQRLSKTYLLWPHSERHIWCFFTNAFHYLGKGCVDEPVQQKKKYTCSVFQQYQVIQSGRSVALWIKALMHCVQGCSVVYTVVQKMFSTFSIYLVATDIWGFLKGWATKCLHSAQADV